jgi:ABC-type amino acid transport substrate-binding protein
MKTLFAKLGIYSVFVSLFLENIAVSNASNIHNTPPIKAGISIHFPNFGVSENRSLIVDDAESKKLISCVEKYLNTKIAWYAYPTARVESMLLNNEIDFIFPFQFTQERLKKMLASTPTWKSGMYFLANRNIDVRNKNLRVAARVNSPEHQDLIKKGYKKISTPYDYSSLIRMLSSNTIDVAAVPEVVYFELKNILPKDTKVMRGETREAGFLLNKDDPKQLLNKLNAAIVECHTGALN